jgi:hypothetical protein
VARQPTGPLFGVELLPKETALLVSARQDPKQRAADLPDSIDQIGWMFGSELDAATKARWVETLSKAQAAMAGEGAFGVWPAEGSIGFGGVQGVVDDAAGRAAFHTIMAWVAKDLWPMAANSQTKPAIRIVVRKNAFRAGGAAADTLEVAIAWPKDKADARQVVQRLFGPRLVVAVAFAHKRAYFAFGKDYKARLAWLVKAGAGGAVANATQADGFAAAAKFHDQQRAGLLYLRLLDAARAVGLTVLGSGELSASDRPIAEALARLFGQGALLFSWNVDGNAYVIHGRLDKDGIADTVKAVMAVVMAKAAGAAAGAAPNP